MSHVPSVFELADRLALLKDQEHQATVARVAMEWRLVAALQFSLPEGSKSFEAVAPDDLALAYRVTCKQPVARKLDEATWDIIKDEIPEELWPVRPRIDLHDASVRLLQKNHPEHYLTLCRAMTSRAGKIGVEVKQIEPS